jgi:phage/plasmid-associated DNA primase
MYLWDEWSKGGKTYKAKEILTTWNSLHNSDIRGSCLRNMAIKENPTLYYEYFPKPDPEFIDDEESSDEESDDEDEPSTPPQPPVQINNLCVSIHEQDIGQYIIDTYLKDSYVCVSLEDNTFFYYNNNRWIEDKGNITLFKYITKDYLKDVVKYQNEAQAKVNKLKDDDKEKAILTSKLKNVCKLLAKLKGKLCNFEGVVDWIAKELYNPKFYDLCDENICLLGFDNGVYDTKTKTFRDGKPSDYVTKSVGYNFPIDDKGYRKDIDEFLKKVFPDKELRKYVLHQQAQALSGMKGNDCVYTHSGKGSNGKSIEQILLTNVFGDYFLEIPSTMLTKVNKMEHNKPDPFYTEMKGVRYSIANEPSDGSKINDSLIKIMGSKEGLKFRTLFSKVVEKLKLQTQLHIYCNNKLDFNANDGGVVRRLKVIDYVSKFSEDNNLINEANNIYSMDTELSEKVKLWREDYMKMLLEIYDPKYKYVEPEAVKNSSSNYCDANNDVKRFITEHFELTNKKEDYLLLKDIKATYSCNKEYDQSKIKNFKEHIEKEMNVSVLEKSKVKKDGKWADVRSVIFGWKYRDDESENEE